MGRILAVTSRSCSRGLGICGMALLPLLAACGGGDPPPPPPVAETASLSATEDTVSQGTLHATAADPNATLTFTAVAPPAHGHVQIDSGTGAFSYTPDHDFFGDDSFSFSANDGRASSAPAAVQIHVENVNDPPTLEPIAKQYNSPWTQDVEYAPVIKDPDGDTLTLKVGSSNPAVVAVEADQTKHSIRMRPLQPGSAQISVEVSDGALSAQTSFAFESGTVTKMLYVFGNERTGAAVRLENGADHAVTFRLTHNGFPVFQSDAEFAEYVRNLPTEFPNEPFERKLWRFVRDTVYHDIVFSADEPSTNQPWIVANSLGWGFCSQVSALYVRVARAAGYEARVWGLTGHVVPEIKVDGRWFMYDPDLAVYYHKRDGSMANVADLVADPSLITAPTAPVLNVSPSELPYSTVVAQIYGSASDNYIDIENFVPKDDGRKTDITLPPGAVLMYPGQWTSPPLGHDGATTSPVDGFLQSVILTPAGWQGRLSLPWLLAAISGTGRVQIGTQQFDIGSAALDAAIASQQLHLSEVTIVDAQTPIRVVMYVNALKYRLDTQAQVSLTGPELWPVHIASSELQSSFRVTTEAVNTKPIAIP